MASVEKSRGPKPKVVNIQTEEGEFIVSRDNAQEYIQDKLIAVSDDTPETDEKGKPNPDYPRLTDKKYAAERPDSYSALNMENYTTVKELSKLLRIIASGSERELTNEE